ncbi:hypothetical protein GCM10028807_52040 [Spirosoma daeguense]
MAIFFSWIVLSFVAGAVGSDRKIGFFGAFIISLILSPLIGFIAVFASQSKSSAKFQQQMLEAQQRNSDVAGARVLNERLQTTPVSLDEELRKLKALKDDGLLTEEEFDVQKRRLLS